MTRAQAWIGLAIASGLAIGFVYAIASEWRRKGREGGNQVMPSAATQPRRKGTNE